MYSVLYFVEDSLYDSIIIHSLCWKLGLFNCVNSANILSIECIHILYFVWKIRTCIDNGNIYSIWYAMVVNHSTAGDLLFW